MAEIVREVPIFIASSVKEFERERKELLGFVYTLDQYYKDRGVRLVWEPPEIMPHDVRPEGSQSAIDAQVRECAFFFAIVGRKMGTHTLREFDLAWERRKTSKTPKIVGYFLLPPGEFPHESVTAFRDRLKELGYYYEMCRNMEELKLKMHLELIGGGAFDPPTGPSDRETAARKGLDGIREMIREEQEKIRSADARPADPQSLIEKTDAYAEIARLVQAYHVEPDALLDDLDFLWKQHLYDRGIELGQWLENEYRNDDPGPATWARLKNRIGVLYRNSNCYEQAERYHREALEIRRRLAEASPAAFEPDLAGTCNNLGILLKNTGRMEEAERTYREALEIRRRLAEASPAAFEPDLARTCYNLGLFEQDRGDTDAARRYFKEALALYEKFPHLAHYAQDCRDRLADLDLFSDLFASLDDL